VTTAARTFLEEKSRPSRHELWCEHVHIRFRVLRVHISSPPHHFLFDFITNWLWRHDSRKNAMLFRIQIGLCTYLPVQLTRFDGQPPFRCSAGRFGDHVFCSTSRWVKGDPVVVHGMLLNSVRLVGEETAAVQLGPAPPARVASVHAKS
jgi:hypothetical protein